MTFVEKMARAMEAVALEYGRTHLQVNARELSCVIALAALKAMREPTQAMVQAGRLPTREIELGNGTTATGLGLGASSDTLWRAMIDQAIKEAEQ